MPEAAVAPAPPAAAPAAAAPVEPPAAPAVQPAIEPVAQPVAPAVDPAQPAAPAAPADAKAEPKSSDFSDPEEFLKAHYKWREESGAESGEEPAEEVPQVVPKPGKEGEHQPKAADQEEQEPLTPESLATLVEAKPALKQLFEADPQVKGAFYSMARENAKAKPILELFPSPTSAKFASDTANRSVALRQAVMLGAEDPGQMSNAVQMFIDEFSVVGEDGKPVLDAKGQRQLAEDFSPFVETLFNHRIDGELAEVKERLKVGSYQTQEERDNDEAYVAAVEFMRKFHSSDQSGRMRPDIANLTDEQRAYILKLEEENNKTKDGLNQKQREHARSERQAARNAHESKYMTTFGSDIGKRMGAIVKEKIDAGAFIPSYVLETKDPKTGISVFAKTVYDKFKEKIDSIALVRSEMARLQMLPPSEQSMNARLEYSRTLIDDYLPDIVDAEIRLIRGKQRADTQSAVAEANKVRSAVEPEPQGGATPRPQMLSEEDAYKQAVANVRKQYEAQGRYIDQGELMEKALVEKERLLRR